VPQLNTRVPAYKKRKDTIAEWNSFKKGLNLLLRPTELGTEELAQADNIMLTGSGVVTGRWGIDNYFTVNATNHLHKFPFLI
jgi:hypothetical protein